MNFVFRNKSSIYVFKFFILVYNKNVFQNLSKFFRKKYRKYIFVMVEPLLSGIVLGLVPVTIAGLFVTAYLQYRRGDQATW